MPKTGHTPAFVYVLHGEGSDWYKIGVTRRRVSDRISEMQTGSPFQIRQFETFKTFEADAYRIESALHSALGDHRGSGEWFRLEEGLAHGLATLLTYSDHIWGAADVVRHTTGVPATVYPARTEGGYPFFCATLDLDAIRRADREAGRPPLDADLANWAREKIGAVRRLSEQVGPNLPGEAAGTFLIEWMGSPEAEAIRLHCWGIDVEEESPGYSDGCPIPLAAKEMVRNYPHGIGDKLWENLPQPTPPPAPVLSATFLSEWASCPGCGRTNRVGDATLKECSDCGEWFDPRAGARPSPPQSPEA